MLSLSWLDKGGTDLKIIKEGTKERLDRLKRFECEKCGCIFDADKTEYESGSQYNDTYYFCKCPFCGNDMYNEIVMR